MADSSFFFFPNANGVKRLIFSTYVSNLIALASFEEIILLVIVPGKATEISYTAPVVIVKQRKRSMTEETKKENLIAAAIKQGKSLKQSAIIRSEKQKSLFEEFKEGRLVKFNGSPQ